MDFDFDKLIIPLASSMVGLIPVLINITVGFLDKKSQMARRNNELSYVNQRLSFLTNWYQLQKEVTKTTNDLLEKNSELLKDSSIEIARESERGIVEIETLKKVNDNLITTIEETMRIQSEGKVKRQQAETELIKIENDLKSKLLSLKA